jgi:hypothetical protein
MHSLPNFLQRLVGAVGLDGRLAVTKAPVEARSRKGARIAIAWQEANRPKHNVRTTDFQEIEQISLLIQIRYTKEYHHLNI